jgi:hypothetical protein
LAVAFCGLLAELRPELEVVVGHFLSEFFYKKRAIGRPNLSGQEIVKFLVTQAVNKRPSRVLLSRPSELLTVLLASCVALSFSEDVDEHMSLLDHQTSNAFVPDDYTNFSRRRIERGSNITFEVGSDSDNGVFGLADLIGSSTRRF